MAKRINLKSIAEDLNLTPGTVSRILNGKAKEYRISDETSSLVIKYARENGYMPNLIAKGLRSSKTSTIGLMIPDVSNPFFALMARNIERYSSQSDYSVLLVDSEEDTIREQHQIRNMIGRRLDGIIATPVGAVFDHFLEITNQEIPLVFVDRYFSDTTIPYVSSDHFLGGYQATKYLIENGHKDIGLIMGDEIIEPVKERRKGYFSALQEAGLESNDQHVLGDSFSIENGYYSTLNLLKRKPFPTAIFALSNLIGLGVLQAVKKTNLSIPGDISLIVFDDQPYAAFLDPPLTTIKQNTEKISQIAVEILFSLIENKDFKTESTKIPTRLIERGSVQKI